MEKDTSNHGVIVLFPTMYIGIIKVVMAEYNPHYYERNLCLLRTAVEKDISISDSAINALKNDFPKIVIDGVVPHYTITVSTFLIEINVSSKSLGEFVRTDRLFVPVSSANLKHLTSEDLKVVKSQISLV